MWYDGVMKILVLNCGSSSLKFQLINMVDESVVSKGNFEEIGQPHAFYGVKIRGGEEVEEKLIMPTHTDAVRKLFELIGDDVKYVGAIGHRVVHGGEKYKESVIVNDEVLQGVESVSHFAPLHNPANLSGVRACLEILPKIPNVLVFDTSFHANMPARSFMYAIPKEDYTKYGIRRYGFHGTSYSFVVKEVAKIMGKPVESLKMVVAHLGNGASICAIDGGKSMDTSMGLTPLEGLVMGTRSGDIDPAVISYLAKAKNKTVDEIIKYLNSESGLKGLSAVGSNDMRVLHKAKADSQDAQTAIDVMVHRVKKYVGGYTAILGGIDALVFTGGVGTNDEYVREHVTAGLEYMGIVIDTKRNENFGKGKTGEITGNGAKVRVFVVNTNEELEIAKEAVRLVK